MSKHTESAENQPAGVRKGAKDIQVAKLVGRKMQNHDRKLYPKRIFSGLRKWQETIESGEP